MADHERAASGPIYTTSTDLTGVAPGPGVIEYPDFWVESAIAAHSEDRRGDAHAV
jgi:hypothetical protein